MSASAGGDGSFMGVRPSAGIAAEAPGGVHLGKIGSEHPAANSPEAGIGSLPCAARAVTTPGAASARSRGVRLGRRRDGCAYLGEVISQEGPGIALANRVELKGYKAKIIGV